MYVCFIQSAKQIRVQVVFWDGSTSSVTRDSDALKFGYYEPATWSSSRVATKSNFSNKDDGLTVRRRVACAGREQRSADERSNLSQLSSGKACRMKITMYCTSTCTVTQCRA